MLNFNIILLAFSVILFTSSPSYSNGNVFNNAKKIDKTLKEISPELYAAETEVSNIQYEEFLSDLLSKNLKDDYKKCLPDSMAWEVLSDTISTCFEYFYNYHTSKSYNYYPVVNIPYEAASLFCKWLTDKYNNDSERKFKKVEIKLPDKSQWIMAAGDAKASFAWGDDLLYGPKGGARARLHFIDKSNLFIRDFPATAAPVKSFIKYKYGLYNIHGNVAEMLDVKGTAKGGSWYDIPENAILSKTQSFTGPDPRIGFRYFMVVIEK